MIKKALVIEDDCNIADLLRLYLEKDGFDVSIASDGGKGVELAGSIEPDIILLDIMLPVMDGWQVCREIRKVSNIPIIMLTATSAYFRLHESAVPHAAELVYRLQTFHRRPSTRLCRCLVHGKTA